jgi:hypothetical protein
MYAGQVQQDKYVDRQSARGVVGVKHTETGFSALKQSGGTKIELGQHRTARSAGIAEDLMNVQLNGDPKKTNYGHESSYTAQLAVRHLVW